MTSSPIQGARAVDEPVEGAGRRGRRLPVAHVPDTVRPEAVHRSQWQARLDELLAREKAHTREGDAIAAARRRLPMVEVDPAATVVGPAGKIPFLEAFEGRRMLVGYFHMWHDGQPWEGQCEGCTGIAWQLQPALPYLNSRDVTLAVFTEGEYAESRRYADWLGYRTPWYSARGSSVAAGRPFGFYACFLRTDDGAIYETYWSTDRGTDATLLHYTLLDRTVYGRQEQWEESPEGWPRLPAGEHPWRVGGRPIAQWAVTDRSPVAGAGQHSH
jgi:predicted dithiol-disulfide oxidoreductase (DUF899 family)